MATPLVLVDHDPTAMSDAMDVDEVERVVGTRVDLKADPIHVARQDVEEIKRRGAA